MKELLQRFIQEKRVDAFDSLLGKALQPEGGWLSLFLIKALRNGHTAIFFHGNTFFPTIQDTFFVEKEIDEKEKESIQTSIFQELERGLFQGIEVGNGFIALKKQAQLERLLFREIRRLSESEPFFKVPFHDDPLLSHEQNEALHLASQSSFFLLTGGPGTGKTYTVGRYIQSLLGDESLRILLLAPTGKAVKTLKESIQKALLGKKVSLDAKTIHSLLYERESLYPAHVVVIDESSMIDSRLLYHLLKRFHKGVRIVMLGDPYQLPPIEPGQPFIDLVERTPSFISTFSLQTSHRTDKRAILDLASSIKNQDKQSLLALLIENSEIKTHFCDDDLSWKKAEKLFEESVQGSISSDSILLSPLVKGPFGAISLNKKACDRARGNRFPIIVTKNNYDLQLMNGDMGILEKNDHESLLHFPDFSIPAVLCPHIEKAYAISVHKSQGSEFRKLFVLLPPSANFGRKLLYTAITRAKEELYLLGSKEKLLSSLNQEEGRATVLKKILEINPPNWV